MRWNQNGPKSSGGGGTKWSDLDLAAIEAEVFLLGHWENFDELEEKLNLKELEAVREALYKKESRANRFSAAIQGIKLDDEIDQAPADDIVEKPVIGERGAGMFGVGAGLGYELEGGNEE